MNYKVLVSDIDGTLLPSKTHEIPARTVEALHAFQQKGYTLAVASGRGYQGIVRYAKQLKLDQYGGYIIANNGAEIIDFKSGEILYQNYLDNAVLDELLDASTKLGTQCAMIQDQFVIVNGYNKAIQIDHDSVDTDFIWPKNMRHYLNQPTMRFTLTSDTIDLDQAEEQLRQLFQDRVEILRSQRMFIDVVNRGVDKGIALEALAKRLNLPIEVFVACGDGGNDIGMIKRAGLGVAMQNAYDKAKEVAQVVAPAAEDSGVAWVVENYF